MHLSRLCSSWAIGIVGKGDAGGAGGHNASLGRSVWESYGRHVQPFSLYLAQKDGLDLPQDYDCDSVAPKRCEIPLLLRTLTDYLELETVASPSTNLFREYCACQRVLDRTAPLPALQRPILGFCAQNSTMDASHNASGRR